MIRHLVSFLVRCSQTGQQQLSPHSISASSSAAVGASLGLAALLVVLRLQFHAARRIHNRVWHHCSLLGISLQGRLRHFNKCLLDRGAVDGARLVKEHVVVFAGPLLPLRRGHLPLRLLVQLVPQADEGEGLGVLRSRILIEAISPAG